MFRKDGTTRTSGWTFYGAESEGAGTASIAPRRSTPAPSTATSPTPAANAQSIIAAIRATSKRHERNRALGKAGLSRPQWHVLFQALIEAESNYRPTAQSPKGAYGLGQLMPETARALGVDRRDVAQNLDGAARYLLAQLATFENVEFALAAYNAGPHRVVEYGGVPPFSETRAYIKRINHIRARLSGSPAPIAQIQVAQETTTRWPALVLKLN